MKTKKIKLLSKKCLITLFVLAFFLACDSNTGTDTADQSNQSENVEPDNMQSETQPAASSKTTDIDAMMKKGEQIYKEKCMVCHQENGEGLIGTFPPLAKSDYLMADKERAIQQTLTGSSQLITVNGIKYPGGVMPPQQLDDEQTSCVITYVMNSWGNDGGLVTIDEVVIAKESIDTTR